MRYPLQASKANIATLAAHSRNEQMALPTAGKAICSFIEWAANVAMFALLAWSGYRMALDDFEFEVTSPGLGLPQWLYTAWLPLLSAVIVIRLFLLALARRRKSS